MAWEHLKYDALTRAYLLRQDLRLRRSAARLSNRPRTVFGGRVVPSAGDLPIGRGRRMEASILFLDICGFSVRSTHTEVEQEVMLRSLTLFFSEMIAIVQDYGGTVEKNTGDGLMAYFITMGGVSDVVRSVGASMTILDAATRWLNPVFRSEGVEPFAFRISIDRGWVTIANVGIREGFRGIVAIGTTANIASKMLGEAEPMTILVGNNVATQMPRPWSDDLRLKTDDWGWSLPDGQPYRLWESRWRWPEPPPRRRALGGFYAE